MSPVNMLEEMSNFVFTSRYAKYIPELKRRETWDESVQRSEDMHLKKFRKLSKEDREKIRWAFSLVREKRVLGSMRAQQFAGIAIESKNPKIYNCVARHIDCIRAFPELFYLALNGCGTTFGLSRKFVNRLPDLVNAEDKNGVVVAFTILDTIEGWSDALEALLMCYLKNTPYTGRKIVFDYSRIRKKGTLLKTTGGKAPGFKGLKQALSRIKELLDKVIEEKNQTRLKTCDVCDILCHTMDAVLSGGIRRSAAAAIFDADDEDMIGYKIGEWWKENKQRERVNISALILRSKTTKEQFKKIIERTKEFGDPGFVFADSEDQLFNPCYEISFIPITKDGICGCQFCNLSTINGKKVKTKHEFRECVEAATIIGTMQAAYTNFSYLSAAAKELTEEEALLGVSITGIMDSPDILLNTAYLDEMSELAVRTNRLWAKKIGINPAARVTCMKPEGSGSLVVESSSGATPHHDYDYFRRIQNCKNDNVYRYFKKHNPHMCEESVHSANHTDDIISFPVSVPKTCIVKKDLSAIKHLSIIKSIQKHWVNPGSKTEVNKKPLTHNVSCTVEVADGEWGEVTEYLYKNKADFAAVSLLPKIGDKIYKQAPNERVADEKDRERFNNLLDKYVSVDYTKLVEDEDETYLQQEASCAGGKCQM